MVIGTTGFDDAGSSRSRGVAAFAANFSVGVNVMLVAGESGEGNGRL